ncbi:hypothetical protein OFP26_34770, partial [Escherichia coli]|nr:hypothetical protein [Escherichia coli]
VHKLCVGKSDTEEHSRKSNKEIYERSSTSLLMSNSFFVNWRIILIISSVGLVFIAPFSNQENPNKLSNCLLNKASYVFIYQQRS